MGLFALHHRPLACFVYRSTSSQWINQVYHCARPHAHHWFNNALSCQFRQVTSKLSDTHNTCLVECRLHYQSSRLAVRCHGIHDTTEHAMSLYAMGVLQRSRVQQLRCCTCPSYVYLVTCVYATRLCISMVFTNACKMEHSSCMNLQLFVLFVSWLRLKFW